MLSRQPTRHEVVLAHMHDTTAYIVASTQPCLQIRDQEVAAVKPRTKPQKTGRVLHPLLPADLGKLKPPESWMMAILLCPGDGSHDVTAFVRSFGPGWRDRVQFYHHPTTDLGEALQGWRAAGLPAPLAEPVENKVQLHAHLGRLLNEWIYQDHRSPP